MANASGERRGATGPCGSVAARQFEMNCFAQILCGLTELNWFTCSKLICILHCSLFQEQIQLITPHYYRATNQHYINTTYYCINTTYYYINTTYYYINTTYLWHQYYIWSHQYYIIVPCKQDLVSSSHLLPHITSSILQITSLITSYYFNQYYIITTNYYFSIGVITTQYYCSICVNTA